MAQEEKKESTQADQCCLCTFLMAFIRPNLGRYFDTISLALDRARSMWLQMFSSPSN